MARPTTTTDPAAIAERALRIARRTALGVLGDHAAADDVAQEVAIAAIRGVDRLRDPGAVDAWIHRIAVRRAIKEARRSSTRRAAEIAGHRLHERTAPDDDPTVRAEIDGALDVLDGLPARQRAALTLRYVHDLDDATIASALGCRAGTVRSLLSRGREALRGPAIADAVPSPVPSRPPTRTSRAAEAAPSSGTTSPVRGTPSPHSVPAPSRPVPAVRDQEDPRC